MKYHVLRWSFFIFGMFIFSAGITMTLNVQHLGIHPWDVLNVVFTEKIGLTIGAWTIIISIVLVVIALFLDRTYIKFGTLVNAVLMGTFVDFYLWAGFLPQATNTWVDVVTMIGGIVVMGVGGGIYNAASLGSGPRDGFMLSLSDKTGFSISRVRITVESLVLIIGFLLGGPVFIFTILFTFIQSPIFESSYKFFRKYIVSVEKESKLSPAEKGHFTDYKERK